MYNEFDELIQKITSLQNNLTITYGEGLYGWDDSSGPLFYLEQAKEKMEEAKQRTGAPEQTHRILTDGKYTRRELITVAADHGLIDCRDDNAEITDAELVALIKEEFS